MHTHSVCFAAVPRAHCTASQGKNSSFPWLRDGTRVAVSTCVTRIDPSSCRGSHSPMCGHGRIAAIPSTRSASARWRSRLQTHPMQDDGRSPLLGGTAHRLPL